MTTVGEAKASRASTASRLGLVLATVVIAFGAYLLVWAAIWPWSDTRRVWSVVTGSLALLVGVAGLWVAKRAVRSVSLIVVNIAACLLLATSVWVLHVVGADQDAVCGTANACAHLLPTP